jgi:hypothetical protein
MQFKNIWAITLQLSEFHVAEERKNKAGLHLWNHMQHDACCTLMHKAS